MKTSKNIIGALLIVIIVMSVGYSTFATQLTINGTAKIVGQWDVRITNVEAINVSEGCDYGVPEYTDTTVAFDAKLLKPGDFITYEITIRNDGNIDALLDNIVFTSDEKNGSSAISFKTSELDSYLEAGQEAKLKLSVFYDEKTVEEPEVKEKNIMGIIEYVQER